MPLNFSEPNNNAQRNNKYKLDINIEYKSQSHPMLGNG